MNPPTRSLDLEVDRVIETEIDYWLELKRMAEAAQPQLDFDDE